MYLEINGFLPNNYPDDSLKYELAVDRALTDQIVSVVGHESLNAMAAAEWLLTDKQVAELSSLLGHPFPRIWHYS
ncbi:pyocin S6 family toxin immunity protein [Pseudomonas petrae]|uniref:Pyocin S6 family toxin immunity protein n=1 Tax=Pseudomonas petrae TaxID=2912190 RepID=A0ABS9I7B0_9PSED|nr:pyocin S6 family toxin immunity protein [Pseudomonas petrae]MCF7534054.1 pyocin S6 family toxin immunity protein [Pseudomonas petrae]MCF7539407.1 pyocin S6 family toxin immunity protein [Pseudomonas petrae]MCF7543637.1 pyocin S6 family toxin immunity protein [Pseudomonas petrae]MCF7557292.1 pyocin S6 family toxin immunity protein [Pseudomonas petrae]